VLAECDGLDGVVDGLIQDPRNCHFNPKSLKCAARKKTNCLNNQQVKTLRAIFSGAVTNGNQSVYPGYSVSDIGTGRLDAMDNGLFGAAIWRRGTVGTTTDLIRGGAVSMVVSGSRPEIFVFNDPNYNSLNFNLRHKADVAALNAILTPFQLNANNTDLSPFFNASGKLLMYHGWSDPAIPPDSFAYEPAPGSVRAR